MIPVIQLPRRMQLGLAAAGALVQPRHGPRIDFGSPLGEAALAAPDSLSWRIFKNPVALLVGGIAAVILELAEPAVRTGVWQHSTFLDDPVGRLRRTGTAAMVTVYGARSLSEPMIRGVVRMHARINGSTPSGEAFCANDPHLLDWVQATASFGFGGAYSRYVEPLDTADFDRLYREGAPASRLYGACNAPRSAVDMRALFDSQRGRLEFSPIIFEFLQIMREAPALPTALQWLQPMLVRAAVELIPGWIRERLRLDESQGLRAPERLLMKIAGSLSDKILLPDSPPAQSCRRMGLPSAYLYRRRAYPLEPGKEA
jgi:uncharacterized protein (DUF2236 family)